MDNKEKDINISDLALFKADSFAVFIFKKTQVLINALYLVTNLYPEVEPMKLAIRSKAVNLLEDVLALSGKTFADRKAMLGRFVGKSLEIVALSEVSVNSHLMSSMNFEILKSEFKTLIKAIESQEERGKVVLDEKLFIIPELKPAPKKENLTFPVSFKGQPLDPARAKGQIFIKDNGQRQKAIMDILKNRDQGLGISIKEIGEAFPELGDKTLQRELQKMVSAGILKKMGERRWSRYSVI